MSMDNKSMMQKKFVNPLLSLRTQLLITICLRIPCKVMKCGTDSGRSLTFLSKQVFFCRLSDLFYAFCQSAFFRNLGIFSPEPIAQLPIKIGNFWAMIIFC